MNVKDISLFFLNMTSYAIIITTFGLIMALFWESTYTCASISIGDVFKKFGHVCDSDLNKAITYSLINYAGSELKPIKLCDNDITKWLKSLDKKKEDAKTKKA